MRTVYLDNSATTKPCGLSVDYTVSALNEFWGNPSSLHLLGFHAENKLKEARSVTAKFFNVRDDEIFFTSCGTEANNTAIFGGALSRAKRGNRIVTTAIEHPSVLEAVKALENEGFEVVRILPDKGGMISEADIKSAVNKDTVLVSIMLVNNELGTIQPVRAAADAIRQSGAPALLHCDAVQAFGKLEINPLKLGVDLMSISAHKIHGPKGVGALYIKKGVHIKPLILGGGQENGMRSGTESLPLIYGMCGAIKALPDIKKQFIIQKELWQYAKEQLLSSGLAKINSPDDCLPYILNISVVGYRSETLLHFLEGEGVYVSSGSACAKGAGSYVLNACGFDRKRVDSALRLSFSRENTKEDVDCLCNALKKAVAKLRKA